MEEQNKPTIEGRIEFLEKKINTFSAGAVRIIIISLLLILGNILLSFLMFDKPGGVIVSCVISIASSIYLLIMFFRLYQRFGNKISDENK